MGLFVPRRYTIADNTKVNHPFWLDLTGDGQMMVVNGATLTSQTVWRQEVAVNPFSTYSFGASLLQQCCVASWPGDPSANITILTFLINNIVIGTHTTTGFGIGYRLATSWNAGGATLAMLQIRNEISELQNNDFVLDNLSMTLDEGTPVPEPATLMLLGLGPDRHGAVAEEEVAGHVRARRPRTRRALRAEEGPPRVRTRSAANAQMLRVRLTVIDPDLHRCAEQLIEKRRVVERRTARDRQAPPADTPRPADRGTQTFRHLPDGQT